MKNDPSRSLTQAVAGLALTLSLCACTEEKQEPVPRNPFSMTGVVRVDGLTEISGIQAGPGGAWYVHNDEGKTEVHIIDLQGEQLATVGIGKKKEFKWHDPEDLTLVPGPDGPILVLADMGDNAGKRKSIRLVMAPAPVPDESGDFPKRVEIIHTLKLRYPDGPRDCEAMSYDPSSGQVLFLTKRDHPPRLYAIGREQMMEASEATLEFLGEVPGFREPTAADLLRDPARGMWVSQPTGMDISPDGTLAAVITYRSLYLFERAPDQSWPEAFTGQPYEFEGPPGTHDEAVGFSPDQDWVIVTAEGISAPIFRLDLKAGLPASP